MARHRHLTARSRAGTLRARNTTPQLGVHTAVTNPRYDDEDSAHGLVHGVYHAVEPHVDDTMSFEHEHPSLWHEMQAADEEWAAEHEGEPGFTGGMLQVCIYTPTTHPHLPPPLLAPPTPPNPWYPPQPPKSSYNPHVQPQPPHSRYQGNRPRAPRHGHGYRPRYTTSTPRERYRRPRLTIGDVYGKRGLIPLIPLSQSLQIEGTELRPTRPSTLLSPLYKNSHEGSMQNVALHTGVQW
jgi:hypothetical protein